MALKRRTLNNIIIFACVIIISALTLLDRYMSKKPTDASPLFDASTPLTVLQLDGILLERQDGRFSCDAAVTNCEAWGTAWLNLSVSPLTQAPTNPEAPRELVFQVGQYEPQLWLLFADGLLKSPQGSWYSIPKAQRPGLEPIQATKPAAE